MTAKTGRVVLACLVPHPPVMVPEVGGVEAKGVRSTAQALQQVGARLARLAPEVLVFITPHGPLARDVVFVAGGRELTGDLGAFGAPQVSFRLANDLELASAIRDRSREAGLGVQITDRWSGWPGTGPGLDHGITAPLYYLGKGWSSFRLVALTYALWPRPQLYRLGMVIQEAVEATGRRAAVVASGDLSHRLLPGAPAGYDPRGEEFDRRLRELLERGARLEIVNLPEDLAERAGECGWRSLVVGLGTLEGYKVRTEVLSYEGPFGVGYLVACLEPEEEDPAGRLWELLSGRGDESWPVRLARQSLEAYVREGRQLPPPRSVPPEFDRAAGAFVSLKKHGQLRGCIGTIRPTRPRLAEEIIANAISAGTRDPRFEPVRPEELPELTYSVDVLTEPEPVRSPVELDPKRYGVIVRRGWRTGVLLPDLEGVDTVEEQLRIAKLKAGIAPEEDCEIERFEVKRYY
ncbi:MAG: AmmeMemoRadiSam system protein A [Moorellales bacterium]